MQTVKEKGIKVFVFHYPAVTNYPAFEGWEGCIPTPTSSESEYNERLFAVDTINIVFCPVLLKKVCLKQN